MKGGRGGGGGDGVMLNMDAASEEQRLASRYIELAAAGKDGEFT